MVYKYELTEDSVPRAKCTPDDEIVISGLAGRFPNSHNAKEFEDNLYNKVYMCDDDERRWHHEYADIPKVSGKTYGLEKFDSTFFRINATQADALDPQMRVMMEHAYEAIVDAGINPQTLRGSKTGVFIAACFLETESAHLFDSSRSGAGYVLTGLGRAMFANRLSYAFDLHGPSCFLDTACSSSLTALNAAFNAIRNGECDAAIVGAANATLHPVTSLHFSLLGVLAKDGVARPFDEDTSGYVRAEAFGCLILQKAKDAKRIYGTVVYSKTSCDGFKVESITYPSGAMHAQLYEEFYREIGIDPTNVSFVEAHATGTIVGDPEECRAIDQVFCKTRSKPLLIGSTKSNMGHAESSAGLCSLIKCLFALENKLIAPNLNFSKVRKGIEGFEKNRLQVVTEPQQLEGPLIGINSFGLGGSNAHCLLRASSKEKFNGGRPLDKLPRLVNWAGRTEAACDAIFDDIASRHLDTEYIGLIHGTQEYSSSGNMYRSFGVFDDEGNNTSNCLSRSVQHFSGMKPKVVFIFSGMGSQWPEMGTRLLEIPLFKKSIKKCHDILVPKGLNLIKIITSNDKSIFDNVVNSFVGIAAIQIGICDILQEIGVQPDLMVGHSVGELGCAYADGCLTAEEMILCAYSRGLATNETETIYGAMAAVGLGYQQIKAILPDEIDVACHNSSNSCTISGPKKNVDTFVAELKEKGIFAKEVPVGNRAYHSRYISKMGPKLKKFLKSIISNPKPRSKKWLSSSFSQDKWELAESQFCTAEYQTNNLLSPVLFEETIALLPANSVTIEIAPHGLLQAILKNSLPNCINISVTQRGNPENHVFFLSGLGKLFQTGIDMSIEKLYPKIEFPVSRLTPRLSHLIKWDHKEDFFVMNVSSSKFKTGEKRCHVSIKNDKYFEYILGHTIDGKCLFPGIGYLQLVWEVFAGLNNKQYTEVDVEFTDVKFVRATRIELDSNITFVVMVNLGSGHFEVTESSTTVVTGYIKKIEHNEDVGILSVAKNSDTCMLSTNDFYKELRLRGYQYNGLFKSILEARSDGLTGKIKWDNNWVTFIDCVLQLCVLQLDTRSLLLPTAIEKLTVRPSQHFKFQRTETLDDLSEINYFEIQANKHLDLIQCGGVEIKGLEAFPISRKSPSNDPILEIYKFVPFLPAPRMHLKNVTRLCAQYILENTNKKKITCVEVFESEELEPLSQDVKEGFQNNPQVVADVTILTSKTLTTEIPIKNETLSQHKSSMVAIVTNHLSDLKLLESLAEYNFEFLILRETRFLKGSITPPKNYNVISVVPTDDDQTIIMLQRIISQKSSQDPTIIKISSHDNRFEWLEPLKNALKTGPTILYAQGEKTSGIPGLVNSIRREFPAQRIQYFFIDDVNAPPFNINLDFYRDQLKLNRAANVLRDGKWGSYRHLLAETLSKEVSTIDHVYAGIARYGDLSSFKWFEGPLNLLKSKKNLIKIQYAALNFRDVMIATGKLPFEAICKNRFQTMCPLGYEFSGVTESGDRIFGINMDGALTNYIIGDRVLTWKCPDNWTLSQAATVPMVYSTVYIALILRGGIKKGNSILIHSGTGGVGLAAIRLCLARGLTVFTTVGSPEKREYLLNNYPELKPNQIGNSRDLSFEKMIKIETNGIGVDFVLNSLSGDKLTASVRCLAYKGKFLEIGKFDLINNNKIGLREFLREITFHAILLDNITESNRNELEEVRKLIDRDIKLGIIQPLPTTIYSANDLQSAFRYFGSGKHIGKVLIKIREHSYDNVTLPVSVEPRLFCASDSSYIILGGLGGFGLELADWLILRGARHLVLSSRTGISNSYQQHRINLWKSYGVRICVATYDIATRSGCANIIKEAHLLGPVAGIFNLAVLLQDGAFEEQTDDRFNNVFGPKSYATEHFDQLSRALCPRLQHFVVFSSIATGRGNNHQTNYSMSNSIMERIMEQRHNDNLPGVAIQWGAIGDVGIVADMLKNHNSNIEIAGTITQGIASCLAELDRLLFFKSPVVSSMVVAEKKSFGINTDIKSVVMKILGIRDIKSISMDAKLSELGMDSMTAVEIKEVLERDFDLALSPQELRALTFGNLMEHHDKCKKKLESNESDNDLHNSKISLKEFGSFLLVDELVLQLRSQNDASSNAAVIMIPGIECVVSSQWQTMASTIKHPVFCIQLEQVKTIDEIPTFVPQITKVLLSKMGKHTKQVYIVSQSFGTIVSLHLAANLEKLNLNTHVTLIDGSPEYCKKLASGLEDDAIQSAVLQLLYNKFIDSDLEFVRNLMRGPESTFLDRLDKFVSLVNMDSQTKYPVSKIKQFAENLYGRSSSIADLDLTSVPTIRSPILLGRTKNDVKIEEDYGLKRCTTHKNAVEVKYFEGDHNSILSQIELSEWIQKNIV